MSGANFVCAWVCVCVVLETVKMGKYVKCATKMSIEICYWNRKYLLQANLPAAWRECGSLVSLSALFFSISLWYEVEFVWMNDIIRNNVTPTQSFVFNFRFIGFFCCLFVFLSRGVGGRWYEWIYNFVCYVLSYYQIQDI